MKNLRMLCVLVIATFAYACSPVIDSSEIETPGYYTCDEGRAMSLNVSGDVMTALLYDGKHLEIGRSLMRRGDSRVFTADDMEVRLTSDTTALVSIENRTGFSCTFSRAETARRTDANPAYYVSEYGQLISADYLDGSVHLIVSTGSAVTLDTIIPQVESASGAKYESGDIMWWEKSNVGMLVAFGNMQGHCVRMFKDEVNRDHCAAGLADTGLTDALNDLLRDDLSSLAETQRRFHAQKVDLNNDGKPEWAIALIAPYFCGTGGCTWLVLNDDYSLHSRLSVSDFPVYLSNSYTNGYLDLIVQSNNEFHLLKCTESGYPPNPSAAPVIDAMGNPYYTRANAPRILEFAYLQPCQL